MKPTAAQVDRFRFLSGLTAGKRTTAESEELAETERELEEAALAQMRTLIQQEIAVLPTKEFDYALRESSASQCADLQLPEADRITPDIAHRLYQQMSAYKITANALAREAQLRADLYFSACDRLDTAWRGLTILTTEWKAAGDEAQLMNSLWAEKDRAKAHSRYCINCMETINDTLLTLKWMMENWERFHLNQPA